MSPAAPASASSPWAEDVLYDPLTGLPGRLLQRAHLVHALKRATRTGTQVAVLFLDLDDFRDVNERLGPELGDQVLIVLAARLQACLRGTDLTARLEGDEFAIVCEDLTDSHDLAMVTRRVREALAAPLHIGDAVVEVRASVGSAMSAGTHQPGALLNLADRAMAAQKAAHREAELGHGPG
jgi:diguanylate cyclase (GGDEF)-like protein